MKITMLIATIMLLVIAGPMCFAQTWTYQGSQICFQSSPGNSMCFSEGTLTSTAASLAHSQATGQSYVQSGNAEGAAIGSVVGTLISAWIQHHRRVEAEKKALKQELLAYLDATTEAYEENKRLNEDTANQIGLLKDLDKTRSETWAMGEKQAREGLLSINDRQIQLARDYRANVDKNFKTRNDLDYLLNDKKAGAKTLYDNAMKSTAVSNVINQIYRAVVGYYQNQPHAQPLRYAIPVHRRQSYAASLQSLRCSDLAAPSLRSCAMA